MPLLGGPYHDMWMPGGAGDMCDAPLRNPCSYAKRSDMDPGNDMPLPDAHGTLGYALQTHFITTCATWVFGYEPFRRVRVLVDTEE